VKFAPGGDFMCHEGDFVLYPIWEASSASREVIFAG